MLSRVIVTEVERAEVRVEERALLRELFADHFTDDIQVDVEQRDERTRVGDVAHERALAIAGKRLDAELAERHTEDRDVLARERAIERPRRIVHQPPTTPNGGDVLRVGRRIERDDEVDVRRTRRVAVLAHSDLVPRWQPLNVRRENIFPGDRYAHAIDGLHEQAVGAGGTGAIHRRNLEGEIVDHFFLLVILRSGLRSGRQSEFRLMTERAQAAETGFAVSRLESVAIGSSRPA